MTDVLQHYITFSRYKEKFFYMCGTIAVCTVLMSFANKWQISCLQQSEKQATNHSANLTEVTCFLVVVYGKKQQNCAMQL